MQYVICTRKELSFFSKISAGRSLQGITQVADHGSFVKIPEHLAGIGNMARIAA